jgi:hypothetical protein
MRNSTIQLAADAAFVIAAIVCVRSAVAQGNYEIQVHGAPIRANWLLDGRAGVARNYYTRFADDFYREHSQTDVSAFLTAMLNNSNSVGAAKRRSERRANKIDPPNCVYVKSSLFRLA